MKIDSIIINYYIKTSNQIKEIEYKIYLLFYPELTRNKAKLVE